MTAMSTIDRESFSIRVVDLEVSGMYYVVAIALPEGFPSGEYEYILEGDNVLSTGLMIVRERKGEVEEYNKTITYEQYK